MSHTAAAAPGWLAMACPCGKQFQVLSMLMGSAITCPSCGAPIRVTPGGAIPEVNYRQAEACGAFTRPRAQVDPTDKWCALPLVAASLLACGDFIASGLYSGIAHAMRGQGGAAGMVIAFAGIVSMIRLASALWYLFTGSGVARQVLIGLLAFGFGLMLFAALFVGLGKTWLYLLLDLAFLAAFINRPARDYTPGVSLPWVVIGPITGFFSLVGLGLGVLLFVGAQH